MVSGAPKGTVASQQRPLTPALYPGESADIVMLDFDIPLSSILSSVLADFGQGVKFLKLFLSFLFFFFFVFSRARPMEVPRLGVKSEL